MQINFIVRTAFVCFFCGMMAGPFGGSPTNSPRNSASAACSASSTSAPLFGGEQHEEEDPQVTAENASHMARVLDLKEQDAVLDICVAKYARTDALEKELKGAGLTMDVIRDRINAEATCYDSCANVVQSWTREKLQAAFQNNVLKELYNKLSSASFWIELLNRLKFDIFETGKYAPVYDWKIKACVSTMQKMESADGGCKRALLNFADYGFKCSFSHARDLCHVIHKYGLLSQLKRLYVKNEDVHDGFLYDSVDAKASIFLKIGWISDKDVEFESPKIAQCNQMKAWLASLCRKNAQPEYKYLMLELGTIEDLLSSISSALPNVNTNASEVGQALLPDSARAIELVSRP